MTKYNNLCKTTKICKGNLGIVRRKMPQFDGKVLKEFLKHLKKKKVKVSRKKSINVGGLKATQNQINGDFVNTLCKTSAKKRNKFLKDPIIISKNNYIVDGHHRWATAKTCGRKISAVKIDLDFKKIYKLSKKFNVKYEKIN